MHNIVSVMCLRVLFILALVGVISDGGRGVGGVGGLMAQEALTVYSHRHYPLDRKLFAEFERRHGVRIRVLQAKADELIERLIAEGRRTKADLLVTSSAVRLGRAVEREILTPFHSERIERNIPAELRHPQHYWTALTARARIIAYNTAMVRPAEVMRYQDLMAPRWRGRLTMRTSTHVYNISLLAALIDSHGSAAARRWVDGVARNLAYPPRGNDRDQIRAVARGDAAATLVNSYYYGLLVATEPDLVSQVTIAFPDQQAGHGTHLDISGVGLARHTTQRRLATELMEFLTSVGVQERYAAENYEFPANPRARARGFAAEWSEARLNYAAIHTLANHSLEAVSIFDDSDWR